MNNPLIRLLFLSHFASTLYMVGVIWFVQVIHYPLFANVGRMEFPAYQQRNTAVTTWVVLPPMLIEGATALLLFRFRPTGITDAILWTGLALLSAVWFSTFLLQVPCHDVLTRGFDPLIHQRLVATNWLRTAAWSLRGGLVLGMAWISIR